MLDDVTVIAWGEFGRTPRINGGRGPRPLAAGQLAPSWPAAAFAPGQAIGATNRLGEYAKDRPVPIQEIVATLYHNLGIDVAKTTVNDPTGRPQYLVEAGPLPELIS